MLYSLGLQISGTCPGTYNSTSNYIISSNYPSNYDSNVNCRWYITNSLGQAVALNFTDFNTDYYDKLTIYEGEFKDGKQLYQFYGTGGYAVPSRDELVWVNAKSFYVTFTINSYSNNRGFKIWLQTFGKSIKHNKEHSLV